MSAKDRSKYAPDDTIGFLVWDSTRMLTRAFSLRIARYGLSFGLWPFMRTLWSEDGLTQRELSERVRMKGPTTVAAINRLEHNGMVRRVRSKIDARKINVFLTEKGRRTFDRVIPDIEAVNRQGLTHLSRHEQALMKDLLRRFRADLGLINHRRGGRD